MALSNITLRMLAQLDWQVGLAAEDRELDVDGYERLPVTRWDDVGDGLRTVVVFGPFATETTVDEVRLINDNQVEERHSLGQLTLPPGMEFVVSTRLESRSGS